MAIRDGQGIALGSSSNRKGMTARQAKDRAELMKAVQQPGLFETNKGTPTWKQDLSQSQEKLNMAKMARKHSEQTGSA